jgi:hypothetical protein
MTERIRQNRVNVGIVLAVFVFLMLGCDAWVNIVGKVVDQAGSPIGGAKIVVSQGDTKVAECLSEKDGRFKVFENIVPGPIGSRGITLSISKEGYKQFEVQFDWVSDGGKFKNGNLVVIMTQN